MESFIPENDILKVPVYDEKLEKFRTKTGCISIPVDKLDNFNSQSYLDDIGFDVLSVHPRRVSDGSWAAKTESIFAKMGRPIDVLRTDKGRVLILEYTRTSSFKDGLGWLDLVQTDLEATDYAFAPFDLCAAGFGAPHIRQRLYFVGDASGPRGWRPVRRAARGARGVCPAPRWWQCCASARPVTARRTAARRSASGTA